MHNILNNLISIQKEIQQINSNTKIIAVSKTFPLEKIKPIIDGNHRHFGENKVQEALEKWSKIKEENKNINKKGREFFYRKKNGFDGDQGSRIYLKLLNTNIKYKIFNPYFNIPKDWLVPIPWSINRITEFFLPEKFCYFPKKKSFVKFNEKFGDFLSEKAYESFYWKDYPIGFHIRGHPKRMIAKRDKIKESKQVDEIFNIFSKQ